MVQMGKVRLFQGSFSARNGASTELLNESPGGSMTNDKRSPAGAKLADAMSLMQQALQLLDETDAPADIGAHLDLAIVRLGEAMAKASSDWTELEISRTAPRTASGSTG